MTIEIVTKRFVVCPGCSKHHHSIEHLFGEAFKRTFGGWRCETDDCLTEVSGTVYPDGRIEVQSKTVENRRRGLALLKLRDLYLVRREKYGRIKPERADYFYHSHQCPTNLLHDVVEVYGPSGDRDPHGLIRYVAGIDDTPETRAALHDHDGVTPSLRQVMEMFGTDGEPIATDWPEANGGVIPMIAEWGREEDKNS